MPAITVTREMVDVTVHPWKWNVIVVRVKLGPFVGKYYLEGAPTYSNESEFTTGGLYELMVETAIENLQSEIDRAYELIHRQP